MRNGDTMATMVHYWNTHSRNEHQICITNSFIKIIMQVTLGTRKLVSYGVVVQSPDIVYGTHLGPLGQNHGLWMCPSPSDDGELNMATTLVSEYASVRPVRNVPSVRWFFFNLNCYKFPIAHRNVTKVP